MTGAANRKESTRSSIPPWPGMSVPESLAPAARLMTDSARSPACAARAVNGPRMIACRGSCPSGPEHQRHDERGNDDATDQALDRLRRRDVGQELGPAEVLADQERAGVVGPHGEDQQEDPAPFGSDDRKGGAARDGRRCHPEADQERQERDIERAEDRRHPRLQPVARIDLRERGHADEHDPDAREQHAAALEDLGERRVEDDDEREGNAERREGRRAGGAEQAEDLDRGDGGDDRDEPREDDPAEEEHDQQHRHEHGSTDRAVLHRPSLFESSGRSVDAGWQTRAMRRRTRRVRSRARAPHTCRAPRTPTAR